MLYLFHEKSAIKDLSSILFTQNVSITLKEDNSVDIATKEEPSPPASRISRSFSLQTIESLENLRSLNVRKLSSIAWYSMTDLNIDRKSIGKIIANNDDKLSVIKDSGERKDLNLDSMFLLSIETIWMRYFCFFGNVSTCSSNIVAKILEVIGNHIDCWIEVIKIYFKII